MKPEKIGEDAIHIVPPELKISNEDADRRWDELESGEVEEMSHDDFVAGLDLG